MGCQQSKEKQSKTAKPNQGRGSIAGSQHHDELSPTVLVPAAAVPQQKKDEPSTAVVSSQPEGHNVQVAGHQNLRLKEGGAFLIKPVSRDALIVQHLLAATPTPSEELPFTLNFLRPFVANFDEALFAHANSLQTSSAEVNGLKRLDTMRDRFILESKVLSFEDYFNACRRELEAAEEELTALIPEESRPAETGAAAGSGADDDGDKPVGKKSKTSVKKPWELHMANATAGMAAPAVMDVKLGKFRTSPNAPGADAKEAKDEGTTARINGVRLTGVNYFAHDSSASAGGPDDLTVVSKALDSGWDRKTVTNEKRLTEVITNFLSACVVDNKQKITATGDDKAASLIGNAVFINDKSAQQAVESLGVSFELVPIPALAQEVYKQLSPIVKSITQHEDFISKEFAFLSSSVLIVYDAAAWFKNGKPITPSNPHEAVKVILIDFDRCGPRTEHHSEEKIQYVNAMRALEGFVREAAGHASA